MSTKLSFKLYFHCLDYYRSYKTGFWGQNFINVPFYLSWSNIFQLAAILKEIIYAALSRIPLAILTTLKVIIFFGQVIAFPTGIIFLFEQHCYLKTAKLRSSFFCFFRVYIFIFWSPARPPFNISGDLYMRCKKKHFGFYSLTVC